MSTIVRPGGQTSNDYLRQLVGLRYKPGMTQRDMLFILAGPTANPTDSPRDLYRKWAGNPPVTPHFSSWDYLRLIIGPLFSPGQTMNDMLRHLVEATLQGVPIVVTLIGPLVLTAGLTQLDTNSGTMFAVNDVEGVDAGDLNFAFYYSTTQFGTYLPVTPAQGTLLSKNVWQNGSIVGLWYKVVASVGDVSSAPSIAIQSTKPPLAPTVTFTGGHIVATNRDSNTPSEYVFYKRSLTQPYNFVVDSIQPSNSFTPNGYARYTATVVVNGISSAQGNSVVA